MEKLRGYVKIDTFIYSVSSKLEKFNEKNNKQKRNEMKFQFLENKIQNPQHINKVYENCRELKSDNFAIAIDGN